MLVELIRNDLARIAAPGSVRVSALWRAERFETVHQLTSDVVADLLPGTGLTEMFRAMFPCGSVTGAPKARTILRPLEDSPRGVYCGAVGIIAPPGAPFRARFSVAIRTVLMGRMVGTAVYGSGGGTTWDSDPAAEYAELLAKDDCTRLRVLRIHERSNQRTAIQFLDHVLSQLPFAPARLIRLARSLARSPVTDLPLRPAGSLPVSGKPHGRAGPGMATEDVPVIGGVDIH